MKKLSLFLLMFTFLFSAGNLTAQKLKSGNLKMLKGQSVLNVQYDYSHMKVGKKSADDYVTEGIAERNKKKAGSGDEWAVKWKSDRSARFQPTFEKNFNDKTSKAGTTIKEGADDAKYTMIIKVTFFEPGFQSGVGISKPASLNMIIDVVETAAPDKVLATVQYDKIPSKNMMGYDFDTGSRVQSCFDRAGDDYGKFFYKNGLK
ncbi:MAG: hypothetical protein Q8M08_04530 [Bacteroidales bacterium]|nr:hypothetical protein [Bacteroidales bacterium]